MRSFKLGQIVVVHSVAPRAHADTVAIPAGLTGKVVRLLHRDASAWIEMDHRLADDLHPFPEDDERGTHVLAWPEDCEAFHVTA